MNTIDELRQAMHEAVDHQPTSTVDTVTITSGALRRQRRWMATGVTAVASLAVLTLGASAEQPVNVVGIAAKPPAGDGRVWDLLHDKGLRLLPPPVTVPADGKAAAFTTERGDRIEVTNTPGRRSGPLDGLGAIVRDGSDPARGVDLSRGGWEVDEAPVDTVGAIKAVRVRTSHGVLLIALGGTTTGVAGYAIADPDASQVPAPAAMKHKEVRGDRHAIVMWSYVPDEPELGISALVVTGRGGQPPSLTISFVSVPDLKKVLELRDLP
ncbi:hypothetical protein [Fodinicola acaciae]|uniref:hypothetical protein n=1 Tax=Fodinicola acaciae TaxID=2681555 RepID=UPI0013D704B4|nr:hypothetical protein [Fodinicola acaciae]